MKIPFAALVLFLGAAQDYRDPINVTPPHFSTDASVKLDYDIVYVRAPRRGDQGRTHWTEIAHPALMDAGADVDALGAHVLGRAIGATPDEDLAAAFRRATLQPPDIVAVEPRLAQAHDPLRQQVDRERRPP